MGWAREKWLCNVPTAHFAHCIILTTRITHFFLVLHAYISCHQSMEIPITCTLYILPTTTMITLHSHTYYHAAGSLCRRHIHTSLLTHEVMYCYRLMRRSQQERCSSLCLRTRSCPIAELRRTTMAMCTWRWRGRRCGLYNLYTYKFRGPDVMYMTRETRFVVG